MEDDDMKKSSSLTPNYVTLVQLQQRWLQRKQREKEEEEKQIKRREKEHEDRENQKKLQNKNRDRSKTPNYSFRPRSLNNNGPEKSFGKSQVVTIVEPKKIDDFKKKKKKKKNKGKPRAEEGLIGVSERLLPENEPAAAEEEESLVVSSDVQRNGKNLVVNGGRVWEKKVRVDGSEEIGGKLKEISVSGERYGRNIDGGFRNYNRDPTRSNDRRRVTNKVWVKKGESSEVNFAGVGSAGVAAKDGGQRKPVQMRQRTPVRESYRKRID